jgi:hypothetical protein
VTSGGGEVPGTCHEAACMLVSDLQLAQPMILLHTAAAPHFHPDQLAVALLVSVFIVAMTWMLQRRRS